MATGNIKNFELKVGKAGLIIIVVGMAVLLCTAFLLGIDVGKNIDTYPDKIAALPQKALALVWQPAKIRAAQISQDNKSVQNKSATDEKFSLTYHEDLTNKEGVIKAEAVTENQPLVLPPDNKGETAANNFNVDNKNQPAPVNEKTREKGDIKPKEIAPIIASDKHKFIIQVASLKDKTKANKIIKKIDSLGFTSQVVKFESKGKGMMFRVVVSGFEDKVQADEAAQKISQKTGTSCVIKCVDNEDKKN
jgi:cell division septation protein DedD